VDRGKKEEKEWCEKRRKKIVLLGELERRLNRSREQRTERVREEAHISNTVIRIPWWGRAIERDQTERKSKRVLGKVNPIVKATK